MYRFGGRSRPKSATLIAGGDTETNNSGPRTRDWPSPLLPAVGASVVSTVVVSRPEVSSSSCSSFQIGPDQLHEVALRFCCLKVEHVQIWREIRVEVAHRRPWCAALVARDGRLCTPEQSLRTLHTSAARLLFEPPMFGKISPQSQSCREKFVEPQPYPTSSLDPRERQASGEESWRAGRVLSA